MAAAFAETRGNGHALLQDRDGYYLLMTPIDGENFCVTNLETRVEKDAQAAADEMLGSPLLPAVGEGTCTFLDADGDEIGGSGGPVTKH